MRRSAPSHEGWADTSPVPDALPSLRRSWAWWSVSRSTTSTAASASSVSRRGASRPVTLVGPGRRSPPALRPGHRTWVSDPKHGPQFKATSSDSATRDPRRPQEISRLGHGPGDRTRLRQTARRGIRRDGSNPRRAPERLRSRGPRPQRAERTVAAWAHQRVIGDIMIFLHSHGVARRRAHLQDLRR